MKLGNGRWEDITKIKIGGEKRKEGHELRKRFTYWHKNENNKRIIKLLRKKFAGEM